MNDTARAAAGVLARDRLIRLFKVSTKTGFTPVTDLPQVGAGWETND